MRRIAPLAAAALAAGLLVAAPTAQASSDSSTGYTPPPVSWGACAVPRLVKAGAECGFVTVPLSYAHPNGTKIQLAVSRVKHTAAKYQGVMLVNPGGPGGSGLIYSVLGSGVPNHAGDYYDWIGFDPRGVGSSVPSLSCDGDYAGYDRPQYVPYKPSLEKTWLKKAAGYSADCAKAGGRLLNHLKTVDNARDMDSIRKALGQKKINYYGFSYGTYLGQVYSTLFPNRVRRFVWDGVVNPTRVWYKANLDQDYAFDRNMNVYWRYLAKYDSVFHLGTSWKKIRSDYYDEYWKLDDTPIDGIGPDELNDVMLSAAYYVYGWVELGQAFAALVNNGDVSGIKDMYPPPGPGADNGYAIYAGTQCTDVQWPTSWQKWKTDNWKVFAKAPFATWGNAWFNAPCLTWPAKPGTPVHVTGAKTPPILLIAETRDGATPYSGALKVRSLFKKSVLIEGVGGTTHAGSLSGVLCTDDVIATYLTSGKLPKRTSGNHSDVRCPPVPAPDPTKAAALSASAASGADRSLQHARMRAAMK